MRNSMIDKGLLRDGVAPSYFIEGMLSNVPNDQFAGSYQDVWVKCFNWIVRADRTKLTTASGLDPLVHDASPVCWPPGSFQTFTAALKGYWES
jgi:hypothetical protein